MDWRAAAELDSEERDTFGQAEHEIAIAGYESAARADPEGFAHWARLADRYLAIGRVAEAIGACERGLRAGPSAALHHERGRAFFALGIRDKALGEFQRAVALGEWPLMALKAAMRILATDPDGAPLLAYCDQIPSALRDTAVTRAFRAIALSRLGRDDEARALVDLKRHVVRLPFDPPEGIETFNRALAAEILADPPAGRGGANTAINYRPRLDGSAMTALLAFTRTAIAAYLERRDEMGLGAILPAPPPTAILQTATTVLRRDGRNRQHIHPRGLVSTVYHAQIPAALRNAVDDRGALVLGVCDEPTRGHHACWGARHIRPVEGWLTIFPSHVFHDVVPSGIEEPRISVASDLCPR